MSESIGDYRLIEKLGEGAAGEVFLATPTADKPFAQIGEPIAVKRYKSEILRQHGQLARIQREFQVGSTISHPNLVRIYDSSLNQDRDAAPYLVMEYVDGIPLDKWVEQFFPIPTRLLLRLAEQLIGGVACLHENGITHRDLKPQNIIVTSTFDVKIMDLGVVQIQPNDSPLTPQDKFLGTIRNSSPEMLFGGNYSHQTDLYSIGTVLYLLLHGEQIFAEEQQFARLIRLVENEDPHFDPPAKRTADPVRAAVYDLCHSLMKKRPSDRPANCEGVSSILAEARAGLTSSATVEVLHGYVATALTGLTQMPVRRSCSRRALSPNSRRTMTCIFTSHEKQPIRFCTKTSTHPQFIALTASAS